MPNFQKPEIKKGNRNFSLGIFLIGVLLFAGALVVRGAFAEPATGQPAVPAGLLDAIDVRPGYEQKTGILGSANLWINSIQRWASQIHTPETEIVEKVVDANTVIAYCSPGFQLIGCSGSKRLDAHSNCNPEICGFVGVVPVDNNGVRSTTNATGCKVSVDRGGTSETYAIAYAYCMKSSF